MKFKANLFLTVLAILVFFLLVSLGNWQLDRAQEKQDLLDLQTSRINLSPVEIKLLDMTQAGLRYLPVKLNGKFDVNRQILLDNQVRQGQVGYVVLTPLLLDENKAILVNRGWLPMSGDRNVLPNVDLKGESTSMMEGHLDHFPTVGIKLKGADVLSEGWPAVAQLVDVNKVSARLGYEILPYQVLLGSNESDGYDREWVPMKMGPEKNHGYAFQWFALSAAWVVLYFVVTIKLKRKEE
ncbi:MAG: cytochrome oxidase biosynthesis protein [Cycloclasticus sp. symbiont of Poecilosclerida sp. N]|nr:MAG: cytochrome oxidase biosynthesis protein [Cycloclasticus sp. symbiont of Poecilosclerida sp. N]